jgi:hypothetical protein
MGTPRLWIRRIAQLGAALVGSFIALWVGAAILKEIGLQACLERDAICGPRPLGLAQAVALALGGALIAVLTVRVTPKLWDRAARRRPDPDLPGRERDPVERSTDSRRAETRPPTSTDK